MNKNRIEGVAEQGERATNSKALVIKVKCVNSAVVQRGMDGLLFSRNALVCPSVHKAWVG